MELLIYRLIRVPVISVRYFYLIKDVLCEFVWFTKKYQMFIYYIHLFMSLFIIPSQRIVGNPDHPENMVWIVIVVTAFS